MSGPKGKRYDVVVINTESRIIQRIAGNSLPLNEGLFNAEKRKKTALVCIRDDKHTAEIVPTGKYEVGDKLEANQ